MKPKKCDCKPMSASAEPSCTPIERGAIKEFPPTSNFVILKMDKEGKITDQHGNEIILKEIPV